MLQVMYSHSFQSVSFSHSEVSRWVGVLTQTVFQPTLDILGMVIYATEFVLWCGVFACGGYFNLAPWVRQKMSVRTERKRDGREENMGNNASGMDEGISNAVELDRIPSSTSVFRTPSSVASLNGNFGPEERISG